MESKEEINYKELKECAVENGAVLFGSCVPEFPSGKPSDIQPETVKGLKYAVSAGVRLSDCIVEDIQDHPTKLYQYHYRQVNYLLDRLALQLTNLIQAKGFRALPIPSSQVVDWGKNEGHLSHREVARSAGLGWIGKNNLLVSPDHGARVRLVTVLTDLPLTVDKPLDAGCGECSMCAAACPAGAIGRTREEFDPEKCFRELDSFRKKYGISHHICGVCIKACSPRAGVEK